MRRQEQAVREKRNTWQGLLCARLHGMCFPFNSQRLLAPQFLAVVFFNVLEPITLESFFHTHI